MKTYKVALHTGRVEAVQADRYDREGEMIYFYRNDVVMAEYAVSGVREVKEPRPPGRGPGVLVALALCLMYFVIFMTVGYFLRLFRSESFLIPNPYRSLLVQLPLAWSITLWRGLRWRSLWWSKLSFREACPLTRFPLPILPALIVATLGGTILAQAATNWISPDPSLLDPANSEVFLYGWYFIFATVVLMAPMGEELFFRGLLLHGFLTRYSRTTAVIATAALFALFHLNLLQAAFAFPVGLACGWLFLRTRSLIPGIICHVLANFTSAFLLVPVASALRGDTDPEMDWSTMPTPMLQLAAALFVGGGALLWWQLRKDPAANKTAGEPSTTPTPA